MPVGVATPTAVRPLCAALFIAMATGNAVTGLTIKVTSKVSKIPFAAVTVTVAVCVPAKSPAFGATIKVVLPGAVMSPRVDKLKLPALAPESAAVRPLVGWLPVLVTVTVRLGGTAYPSMTAGKKYIPLTLRDTSCTGTTEDASTTVTVALPVVPSTSAVAVMVSTVPSGSVPTSSRPPVVIVAVVKPKPPPA